MESHLTHEARSPAIKGQAKRWWRGWSWSARRGIARPSGCWSLNPTRWVGLRNVEPLARVSFNDLALCFPRSGRDAVLPGRNGAAAREQCHRGSARALSGWRRTGGSRTEPSWRIRLRVGWSFFPQVKVVVGDPHNHFPIFVLPVLFGGSIQFRNLGSFVGRAVGAGSIWSPLGLGEAGRRSAGRWPSVLAGGPPALLGSVILRSGIVPEAGG